MESRSLPLVFDRAFVMLVEGPDDQEFAVSQISQCGRPDEWQVHSMGGNATNWKGVLGLVVRSPTFSSGGGSIAVVQDADKNPATVIKRLKGYFAGSAPSPVGHGDVTSGGKYRTGLFVFPDGTSMGELEDLLLTAINEPARLALAKDYISDVTTRFGSPKKISKAQLQAYLAGTPDFVKWVKDALKVGNIPASAPELKPFRDFIKKLQGETP